MRHRPHVYTLGFVVAKGKKTYSSVCHRMVTSIGMIHDE